jgi:hypothetical protein
MHRQAVSLPGTVEKIIAPILPGDAEKVEISIQSETIRVREFELLTL